MVASGFELKTRKSSMAIQEKLNKIKELFAKYDQWEDRYREIIQIGKNLPAIDEQFRQETYQVKGCQSQVWLIPEFKGGKVYFQADSDALIVKGIVGMLVDLFSGEEPAEILKIKADFLKELGIVENLSMNRSNGLLAIYKQIQLYAFAFQVKEASEKK